MAGGRHSQKMAYLWNYFSYPNKVKSFTISLWASDSYGTVKSIHGGLHYLGSRRNFLNTEL